MKFDMTDRFINIVTLVLFLSGMAGCAVLNPQPLNTGSGRPEITVSSSQKAGIVSAISSKMLDKGYTMTKENSSKLAFEQESFQGFGQKVAIGVLLGGEDSRTKVVFNFISKSSQEVRVMAEVLSVKATEGGDNRITANRHAYPEWQTFLEEVKAETPESSPAKTTRKKSKKTQTP